jgi:hypothetical protein
MTSQTITCPCGGHTVTLAPGKPSVGGRAAFTCPACGLRRTFVRTPDGAIFDGPPPAPTAPEAPPATLATQRPPSPVPPGAAVAMTTVDDPNWLAALAAVCPAPDWFVLAAGLDPDQDVADVRAHSPRLILAGPRPAALLAEIAAWTGRRREKTCLVVLGDYDDLDPAAAFAVSADAVLDARRADTATERLAAVLDRTAHLPSLFDGG